MEFLLELGSSCRVLRVESVEEVVKTVKIELAELKNPVVIVSFPEQEDDPEAEPHVLQRWSSEWDCFTDVKTFAELKSQDRLTVVPAPKPTAPVSII